MPSLRVLAVIDGLYLAGAEKLLVGLARRSEGLGVELGVVTLRPPDGQASVLPELTDAGARVWTVDASRFLDVGALVRLTSLIRRWGADVVHAHLRYSATLAPLAARLSGRPVMSTFHHVPGPSRMRERMKEAIAVTSARSGSGVLTVSGPQARAFEQRYRLRPGSWPVLPNGIELDPFLTADGSLPDDLRRRVGRGPIVTLVARLLPGKGHRLAIDVWPRVLARVPDAHLLIVGDGPLVDELDHLVHERRLGEHVTLAGARWDVPEIMAGSDLVLLASASEALPTVLIEAAAAGTSVVATRVGGVTEIVEDGHTGRLVAPDDEAGLADAVASLLENHAARCSIGEQARQRAVARFSADRWAADLVSTYRCLAAHERTEP